MMWFCLCLITLFFWSLPTSIVSKTESWLQLLEDKACHIYPGHESPPFFYSFPTSISVYDCGAFFSWSESRLGPVAELYCATSEKAVVSLSYLWRVWLVVNYMGWSLSCPCLAWSIAVPACQCSSGIRIPKVQWPAILFWWTGIHDGCLSFVAVSKISSVRGGILMEWCWWTGIACTLVQWVWQYPWRSETRRCPGVTAVVWQCSQIDQMKYPGLFSIAE